VLLFALLLIYICRDVRDVVGYVHSFVVDVTVDDRDCLLHCLLHVMFVLNI